MNALTVTSTIPAHMEVIPADMVKRIDCAIREAGLLVSVTDETLGRANFLAVELHTLDKALTAHGEGIKKPLNALMRQVREVLDPPGLAIVNAKRALAPKLAAYQRQEVERLARIRREADEAARQAREEAESERARLQAIADAEHALRAAAALALAAKDAVELAAILGEPVEPERVAVAPAPIIAAPIPVYIPEVMAETAKPSVIVARKIKKLDIYNAAEIPVLLGGIELRPVDMAALRRALDAGLIVPGARIIEAESFAMGRGHA